MRTFPNSIHLMSFAVGTAVMFLVYLLLVCLHVHAQCRLIRLAAVPERRGEDCERQRDERSRDGAVPVLGRHADPRRQHRLVDPPRVCTRSAIVRACVDGAGVRVACVLRAAVGCAGAGGCAHR